MSKILYVVHRFYPYPGGSEYYVKNMASETLKRGHEVWVYSDTHLGNVDGINVTDRIEILDKDFDMIVIHGDCTTQNKVLEKLKQIKSKTLYMLIKPGYNIHIIRGIHDATYVSYSTIHDKAFIEKYKNHTKMVYVPHGIPKEHIGKNSFKEKYGINGKMILSCGGYWNHKGHMELAAEFEKSNIDATLVITGYWNNPNFRPKDSNKVKTFLFEDYQTVLDAMAESDFYVMNSSEEGFGLVILEAMLNKIPWLSRSVGGAEQLKEYGFVYKDLKQALDILKTNKSDHMDKINFAYDYVLNNQTIENTVTEILKLI